MFTMSAHYNVYILADNHKAIRTMTTTISSKKCTELLSLSKESVQTWLDSFDTVLTDCDGKLTIDFEFEWCKNILKHYCN